MSTHHISSNLVKPYQDEQRTDSMLTAYENQNTESRMLNTRNLQRNSDVTGPTLGIHLASTTNDK